MLIKYHCFTYTCVHLVVAGELLLHLDLGYASIQKTSGPAEALLQVQRTVRRDANDW